MNSVIKKRFRKQHFLLCLSEIVQGVLLRSLIYILNGTFDMYIAMFVATVIEMDKYRWAYGRKWRPERMVKSTILLPAILQNDEYVPDWEYMREYIKSLPYKES